MPEVVQADGRQARGAVQLLEDGGRSVRVQLQAVLAGEGQAGVVPRTPPRPAFLELLLAPCPQDVDGAGVEGDCPPAAVGLGVPHFGRPTELDNLLGDPQDTGVQVDVLPPQAHRLASAQAPVRDEVEHRVEPVTGGLVEEGSGLLRGPHGDGWSCPRPAPCGDLVFGPDDSFGTSAGGKLDVRSGIVAD